MVPDVSRAAADAASGLSAPTGTVEVDAARARTWVVEGVSPGPGVATVVVPIGDGSPPAAVEPDFTPAEGKTLARAAAKPAE